MTTVCVAGPGDRPCGPAAVHCCDACLRDGELGQLVFLFPTLFFLLAGNAATLPTAVRHSSWNFAGFAFFPSFVYVFSIFSKNPIVHKAGKQGNDFYLYVVVQAKLSVHSLSSNDPRGKSSAWVTRMTAVSLLSRCTPELRGRVLAEARGRLQDWPTQTSFPWGLPCPEP